MRPVSTREALPPRVGLTARFFHEAPAITGLKRKTLLYIEQCMAHWILSHGALPFLVPTLAGQGGAYASGLRPEDLARSLDGLVLQGGVDICPQTYGEQPLDPEWRGDPVRDRYELALLRAFVAEGKPVLGICRGAQLINVAFGGTLYQDITSQIPQALNHRDPEAFDNYFHPILIRPGSRLAKLYPGAAGYAVNTIHHQSVRELGKGLLVEAVAPDGVIEAIRWRGDSYVFGVQWHPEFHPGSEGEALLDGGPILREFLQAMHGCEARVPFASLLPSGLG